MKIINTILIILIILTITSCQKKTSDSKSVTPEATRKQNTDSTLKNLKKLKTEDNFNATEYTYQELSVKIPENFKKKEKNIFFEENGTNLSIIKETSNLSLKDYIKNNYKKLKEDYSNTIKEEEDLNINNMPAKHVKYIVDRKKYLIQIETILIKKEPYIYSLIISGKKKHIDPISKTINNIFSTIKIKENQ